MSRQSVVRDLSVCLFVCLSVMLLHLSQRLELCTALYYYLRDSDILYKNIGQKFEGVVGDHAC